MHLLEKDSCLVCQGERMLAAFRRLNPKTIVSNGLWSVKTANFTTLISKTIAAAYNQRTFSSNAAIIAFC